MLKIIIISLSIFIIVSGCTKYEDLDDYPVESPKIVLHCTFNNDSIWSFHLSQSASFVDQRTTGFIKDATISLYESGNLIETIDLPGIVRSDYFKSPSKIVPQLNKEYSIVVKAARCPDIYASGSLPPMPDVIKSEIEIIDTIFSWDTSYNDFVGSIEGNIKLIVKDKPGIENYYRISMFALDSTLSKPSKIGVTPLGGKYIENKWIYKELVVSDELFDGKSEEFILKFEREKTFRDSRYFILTRALSKEQYLHLKSVKEYQSILDNPFGEPSRVYNNIKDGYGIFAGSTSRSDEVFY